MRRLSVSLLALGLVASLAVTAAEDPIKARKAGFKEFKTAFGGMKKMLDGKVAFDAAGFQKFANDLKTASAQQWDAIDARFPKGSDQGKTEAKAEIWSDWEGFKAAAEKNREASAALASAAAGAAGEETLKKAFTDAALTCKGCHDKYKTD